jgi:hypothetical protein
MGTLSSELGPHLDRIVEQPRVYADANMPSGVVGYMRVTLGWDVLFVLEHDDLRRAPDISTTISRGSWADARDARSRLHRRPALPSESRSHRLRRRRALAAAPLKDADARSSAPERRRRRGTQAAWHLGRSSSWRCDVACPTG